MFNKILAAAAFGAVAMGAHASTNLLTDGNFESAKSLMDGSSYCYTANVAPAPECGGSPSTTSVSGWQGGDVYLLSNSGPWGDPSAQSQTGVTLGDVVAGIQGASTLTADISFKVGEEYLVTWSSAGRSNNGGSQEYTVTAGGVLDKTTITTSPNGWESYSFDYVATSSDPLVFQGLFSDDRTSFINEVSVTAVPEPTSLLMMAIGTLGLLAWRRRAQV